MTRRIIQKLLPLVPATFVRLLGRLQFRIPLLASLINRLGDFAVSGEGIIQHGPGKGLRFNASNCNPGYLMGTSEALEQKILADLLQPGSVFYDVGANAGFYAVIAARLVGDNGHVYAFEPTPELADRIRQNGSLNEFQNLTVIEAAVCERSGSVRFSSSGFDVGNSIAQNSDSEGIEVEAIDLDSWSVGQAPPCVMMLDIEGSEIDALRGALGVIRKHLPVLMVEVHWLGQRFKDFVESELLPLGYVATTYEGDPIPVKPQRYHALLTPQSSF